MQDANKNRHSIIEHRLNKMKTYAKDIDSNTVKSLAEKDSYIRIKGESVRRISLKDSYPLCDIGKDVKNVNSILNKVEHESLNLDKNINKKSDERRIQAYLIKMALLNNRSMSSVIDKDNYIFDNLLFALDEVSLGDNKHPKVIRCDIIGVGEKNGYNYPVVIELKSKRNKTELEKQLNDFSEEILEHWDSFAGLLHQITGRNINNHSESQIVRSVMKVMIWPQPKSKKVNTTQNIIKSGINVIEYEWENTDNIDGIHFNAVQSVQ